ncbi:hypothetical protein BACCOPRO_00472 [Phocaeicola coprophilus DSM 18228 = JCM 13818]|uniref:Uncharacterized protein n=1 Tax=Phocaeicola coprophilus DSM 18228 = JCM 13818 TaxID=547042 RepID=S0F526_9BACT|nr:hypothetical protein BACCOPRO_00472 [Phocaeicola coprophilus DSM 18228 = JCM 13818]
MSSQTMSFGVSSRLGCGFSLFYKYNFLHFAFPVLSFMKSDGESD